MKCIIIFLFFIIYSCYAYSQMDTIVWQQCYGTEYNDDAYTFTCNNNGFLLGKRFPEDTASFGYGGYACIVNVDSNGNIIWENCFGGGNENPRKIIPTNDDCLYLLTSTYSTLRHAREGGFPNFRIVKINSAGDLIWEYTYGGSINGEEVRDAILMPDGGLLMMGRITSIGGDVSTHYGRADIWFCRINSAGRILWEKTIGNQGQENALKIKLSSDTTILMIGGYQESGGMIDCEHMGSTEWVDVWFVEMDLSGEIIRQLCYGGSYNDLGWDIVETSEGYVIVSSTTSNDGDVNGLHGDPGGVNTDIWVCNIDHGGCLIWQKCLGGSKVEYPQSIYNTSDSNYIIIGYTGSHDWDVSNNHSVGNENDIWVVELNQQGDIEWEHCFGGLDDERFWRNHTICKKDDYHYIVAALAKYNSFDVQCDLHGSNNQDIWLFEIKDCSLYMPDTPTSPTGPDTLCTTTDSTTFYSIAPANLAHAYEWLLLPEEAGSIMGDGTEAKVRWTSNWEGEAVIMVRSMNDCGYSAWSEEYHTWAFNCLGIGENDHLNSKIKVYPNPGKDFIIIEWPEELSVHEIHIYDTFGRMIENAQPTRENTRYTWQCASFPKGLYFVGVQTDEGWIGRRVVKLSE